MAKKTAYVTRQDDLEGAVAGDGVDIPVAGLHSCKRAYIRKFWA